MLTFFWNSMTTFLNICITLIGIFFFNYIFIFIYKGLHFFYFCYPLVFSIFLYFIVKKDIQKYKLFSLYIIILSYILNILILYGLDLKIKSSDGFYFLDKFIDTFYLTVYISFNINSLSLIFVILNNLIIILCVIWSWNYNWNVTSLFIFFFFLDFLLKCCFFSHDIFTFFIFFESILISILFFIGVLGLHERKVKALYLFYVYTLLGSFFMLLGIIIIIFEFGNSGVFSLNNSNLTFKKQIFLWPLLSLSFLIKIPVFPFHLWLPEAHVEASTLGSVFLASILLKLGGFGLIKFILPIFPFACLYYTPIIELISCIGFFYCSVTAFRQTDFKKIIAYSSVVHMHLVLFAIFSFNLKSMVGSVLLMVSHGLTSAGIFFCLGCLYDRFLTRNIFYIKSLSIFMPLFTSMFFILILSNTSFPGTINFISELLCLVGIFLNFKSLNILFLFLGLVINTYYNFWLFNRLSFGTLNFQIKTSSVFQDITKRESFILVFLIFFIIFFGFFPGLLIYNLETYFIFLNLRVLI